MIGVIEKFFSWEKEEQMLYHIGRRSALFSPLDDFKNPTLRAYAEGNYSDFNVPPETMGSIIPEMMNRFI